MPGTEASQPDAATVARTDTGNQLIDRLTLAGWLLLAGELGFILFQVQRVRTVDGTRFATAWSQRIEVLGFMMLPPNLIVLGPAVAVAAVTVFLAGRERGPWLEMLLRVTAATSITMFFVGIVSIIEIFTRSGTVEFDSVFLRLGGMGFAAGFAILCWTADQAASESARRL